MNWTADGVVLVARPQGENKAVVSVLAQGRGRWLGLFRPPARARGLGVEPGDRVAARWSARQEDQLGRFTLDTLDRPAARLLTDPDRLAALAAAAALAQAVTAERVAADPLLAALETLLTALESDAWPVAYVEFELAALQELGTPAAPFVAAPLDALARTGVLFARAGAGAPGVRAALAVRARLTARLARFG